MSLQKEMLSRGWLGVSVRAVASGFFQQTAVSPSIPSACGEVPEEDVLGCSPGQDTLLEHFWVMEHLLLPP